MAPVLRTISRQTLLQLGIGSDQTCRAVFCRIESSHQHSLKDIYHRGLRSASVSSLAYSTRSTLEKLTHRAMRCRSSERI